MSRRRDAVGPPRTQRDRSGPGSAFAAVDNQIHFHPDRRLGGFAILVLLRRSALRPAGVHLLDVDTHTWWKAAGLDELPPGTWVRLHDDGGRPLPVEVLRAARAICVRWLDRDGKPVEPLSWDRARAPMAQAAVAEPAGPRFDVAWLGLGGGCSV